MNDQPSAVPPAAPRPPPSSKTCGLAIASLVFGILGMTCILPIVGPVLALVFGIVALNRINKSGGAVTGNGQAIPGLVFGGVSLVMLPIMAGMLFPALSAAREKGRQAECISNVRGIGFGYAMYAEFHNREVPIKLDDLTQTVTSARAFICPSAKDSTHSSYILTGATNEWSTAPNVIILEEIHGNHRGKHAVLYNDGRCAFVDDDR